MAKPSQASEVVQPAFLAESRNVVSAKAARPSGAGSAIPVIAAAATGGSSGVLTCILLGRSVSLRKTGEPERGGTYTGPNTSDVAVIEGRNDDPRDVREI